MPITPTYPGVYIEEIPSGVRTVTGVATSITAFIGRALRGPVNQAVTINSFADFERTFGGLWVDSSLGYAVRDFYLNGGSQAVIVRLFHPASVAKEAGDSGLAPATPVDDAAKKVPGESKGTAKKAKEAARLASDESNEPENTVVPAAESTTVQAVSPKASLEIGSPNPLTLEAVSEGAWGNSLRIRVDHDVLQEGELPQSYISSGVETGDLFNLTVRDTATGATEVFRNVTVKPSPRQIDNVLKNESNLVRVVSLSAQRPKITDTNPVDLAIAPFSARDQNQRSLGVTTDGSDGSQITSSDLLGSESSKQGLYALEQVDLFNLLCLPLYSESLPADDLNSLIAAAAAYCEKRRAFLIVDPPAEWTDKNTAQAQASSLGTSSKNAAVFFPRLKQPNPLRDNQIGEFAPCGAIAGVFARTDAQRGVWKAPAGLEAALAGVSQLSVSLTDAENGQLNQLGINCIRTMPGAGQVIWGARTLQGNDRLASEWKYIPVRRLALYIQESLYRGTQWVVFEPNDEPLWAQIRLNLGAFMHNLFRQGAFQGKSPREAYFVKCDSETTTQNDINLGIVNIKVGFAPLKPAEFVIIQLQQMAGQIQA